MVFILSADGRDEDVVGAFRRYQDYLQSIRVGFRHPPMRSPRRIGISILMTIGVRMRHDRRQAQGGHRTRNLTIPPNT
jgi:hypothetical protein